MPVLSNKCAIQWFHQTITPQMHSYTTLCIVAIVSFKTWWDQKWSLKLHIQCQMWHAKISKTGQYLIRVIKLQYWWWWWWWVWYSLFTTHKVSWKSTLLMTIHVEKTLKSNKTAPAKFKQRQTVSTTDATATKCS